MPANIESPWKRLFPWLLALGLLAGAGGGGYWWWTHRNRALPDNGKPGDSAVPALTLSKADEEDAALLPPDALAFAALPVADLFHGEAGKQLQLAMAEAGPEYLPAAEKWLGLPLEQIDRLIVFLPELERALIRRGLSLSPSANRERWATSTTTTRNGCSCRSCWSGRCGPTTEPRCFRRRFRVGPSACTTASRWSPRGRMATPCTSSATTCTSAVRAGASRRFWICPYKGALVRRARPSRPLRAGQAFSSSIWAFMCRCWPASPLATPTNSLDYCAATERRSRKNWARSSLLLWRATWLDALGDSPSNWSATSPSNSSTRRRRRRGRQARPCACSARACRHNRWSWKRTSAASGSLA